MELRIVYQPRPGFARRRPRLRKLGKLGWRCSWPGHLLNLLTDAPLEPAASGTAAVAEVTLQAGERLARICRPSRRRPVMENFRKARPGRPRA